MCRLLPLALLGCVTIASASRAAPPAAGQPLTFEAHVRPVLKAHCFQCHGEDDKKRGGLDVRLVRFLTQGGKSGPAVVPGRHAASRLFQRLKAGEMPPGDNKKVPAAELDVIARWIDQGARTAKPEPEQVAEVTDEERSYWAFQPVRRPAVPSVQDSQRVRTPVDAFLLARLERERLSFAPEADRRTLIRRAYFDLLGLPPAPEAVERFARDPAADAYDRLLDELLASPHYGERWGRHWLDVAGYADSDGFSEKDLVRSAAWRYRDYVVRSFNADKPLDRFIVEQLAGDELLTPPYKNLSPEQTELLTATGFLRMAPDGTGDAAVNQDQARNEVVAETIKIVSSSLLGLTVGCAQCHDHRYDPIPQADYYRFRAVFEPALDWKNWRTPAQRLVSLQTEADKKKAAEIDAQVRQVAADRLKEVHAMMQRVFDQEIVKLPEKLREPVRQAFGTPEAKRTAEQKKLLKEHPSCNITVGNVYLFDRKAHAELTARYDALTKELQAKRPVEEQIHALTEAPGKVPTTYVFRRGDPHQPAEAVEPGELAVLGGEKLGPAGGAKLPTTGRRLAYARHLTSGQHPLVARVLVNRVWHHHFGRGLVGTPGDFGRLGERPSHPELLDWLASDLVANGWRLKRMHKLIMTSSAYRQESKRTPALEAADPENRLLARMSVRRLESEVLRDAMLAVHGRLAPQLYGPPVPVMPDEVGQVVLGVDTRDTAGRPTGKVVPLGEEEFRRSVYVQVRRSLPVSMFEAFDAPLMTPNCDCRSTSTVAPQSLFFMNNTFVLEQAKALAERARRDVPGDNLSLQVKRAWQLAFGTAPGERDLGGAVAFVEAQVQEFATAAKPTAGKAGAADDPRLLALANYCQALLSSNRFLYVD